MQHHARCACKSGMLVILPLDKLNKLPFDLATSNVTSRIQPEHMLSMLQKLTILD